MDIEELRELCRLTVELTRLRQNECKHLCIENFAPELLGKLIRERMGLGGATWQPTPPQPWWEYPWHVPPVGLQPTWVPPDPWAPSPFTVTCSEVKLAK